MTTQFDSLLKAGEVEQARTLANQVLSQKTGDRDALVTLARIAVFEGDFGKAGTLIAKATLDGVESVDSLLVKAALAAARDEQIDNAKQLYERAIRESKDTRAEAFFGLGMLLASVGQFVAARKPLQKAVELDGKVAQFQFHLARVLFADEKLAEGLPHLEQSILLNPLYLPAYEACTVVLQEFGYNAEAEKLLREGLKLMEGQPQLETLLSNVLVAQGKVPEAVALSMKVAEGRESDPVALANYARVLMATGHRDKALKLVQELEAKGHATPQSYSIEAMILETNEPPDLDGAVAAWASAAKADPRDWASLNNLAHLLMRREEGEGDENVRAAIEALLEARRRAPWRLEPLMNLALAFARLDDVDEARAVATELVNRAGARDQALKAQAQKLLETLG